MVRNMRIRNEGVAESVVHFGLLCFLFVMLWLAGGAARGDVAGQIVVRSAAWVALIAMALFGARISVLQFRPVAWFLFAGLLLVLVQLIPLPPGLWGALPGRGLLADAMAHNGQAAAWRPLSIVPGATANAAGSLVVPVAVLLLFSGLSQRQLSWIPGILLAFIFGAMLLGLLQFSGVRLGNPMVNDTVGQVSGVFANRNHFALLLAIGCTLLPAWTFQNGRDAGWRAPLAIGGAGLFILTILATGSRAGLLLGIVGLAAGLILVRRGILGQLRRYPRWVAYLLIGGGVLFVVALVFASIAADRAISVDRMFLVDSEQDIRARSVPTMLATVAAYFPAGTGLGSFDPMFRLYEPFELLKPTYFNHAHNDYLEIVLDAGLPGLLLLAAALLWWLIASVRAWYPASARLLPADERMHRRLGSVVILLIALASIVDYPARTPIGMALLVIAACWLTGSRSNGRASSPLPATGQSL